MSRLAEYAESRELTINLTLRELRGKYKRSVLGWSWSLLNPLATMLIFTVIFSAFLKVEPPVGEPSGLHSFALYLLCGLLPWNFLSAGITGSMGTLLGNSNLVKKVYFPREVLVASSVAALFVSFLVEMGVLVVVLLAFGNMVLPWLPMMLVIMAIQTVFVLGIGLALGVVNVYFRDVQYLVTIALQALFYSTPIVYTLSYVPERSTILGVSVPVRELYELNPLVVFVECYRDVLYDLRFPSVLDLGYLVVWSVALLGIGFLVFRRFERRLAEEL